MEQDLCDLVSAWMGGDWEESRREPLLSRLSADPGFRSAFVEEVRMLGMLKAVRNRPRPRAGFSSKTPIGWGAATAGRTRGGGCVRGPRGPQPAPFHHHLIRRPTRGRAVGGGRSWQRCVTAAASAGIVVPQYPAGAGREPSRFHRRAGQARGRHPRPARESSAGG